MYVNININCIYHKICMTQKFVCYPSTNFYVYNLDNNNMISLKKFIEINEKNIFGTNSKIDELDEGDIFFIYEKGKNSGFSGMCKIKNTSEDTPNEKYNVFNDQNKNKKYMCASNIIWFNEQIKLLQISEQLKKNIEFKSSASFSNRFIKKSSEFVEMSHGFGKTLLFTLQKQNEKNNDDNEMIIVKKNPKRKKPVIESDDEPTESDTETNDKSNETSANSDDDTENDNSEMNSATESYGDIYESDSSDEDSDSELSTELNNDIPIMLDPCRKFIKTDDGIKFRKQLCEHVIKCPKCKITNNNKMELFNEHVLNDCYVVIHDDNTDISKIKNGYHNMESYFMTSKGIKNKNFIMDVVYVPHDNVYRKCYFLCLHKK